MSTAKILVANAGNRAQDGWDDPQYGRVAWRTLISADIAPSDSLSAGVAWIEPGCRLNLHRHEPAEIYFILEGAGVVTINSEHRAVSAGDAVFIPADAEHGIRNDSQATLRFFYAFAKDSFAEVVYRFPESLA